jgi:hypothetical protein
MRDGAKGLSDDDGGEYNAYLAVPLPTPAAARAAPPSSPKAPRTLLATSPLATPGARPTLLRRPGNGASSAGGSGDPNSSWDRRPASEQRARSPSSHISGSTGGGPPKPALL